MAKAKSSKESKGCAHYITYALIAGTLAYLVFIKFMPFLVLMIIFWKGWHQSGNLLKSILILSCIISGSIVFAQIEASSSKGDQSVEFLYLLGVFYALLIIFTGFKMISENRKKPG